VANKHEIVVYHSALGLRPGLKLWADRLRSAGHTVHTPDLYDGEFFEDATGAVAKIQQLGFDEILARSQAAVSGLPPDLVYIGFSNGGACAELVTATRPGARGAVLIGAPLPIRDLGWKNWPGVPVQIHFGEQDPLRRQQIIDTFSARVQESGTTVQEHRYPDAAHHFADPGLAGYNAIAYELLLERVQGFLDSIPRRTTV